MVFWLSTHKHPTRIPLIISQVARRRNAFMCAHFSATNRHPHANSSCLRGAAALNFFGARNLVSSFILCSLRTRHSPYTIAVSNTPNSWTDKHTEKQDTCAKKSRSHTVLVYIVGASRIYIFKQNYTTRKTCSTNDRVCAYIPEGISADVSINFVPNEISRIIILLYAKAI